MNLSREFPFDKLKILYSTVLNKWNETSDEWSEWIIKYLQVYFFNSLKAWVQWNLSDKNFILIMTCEKIEIKNTKSWHDELTFHDINDATDITLFDNETFGCILNRVHTIHYLTNLIHIQILHEIIVQNCRFDKLTRSTRNECRRNSMKNNLKTQIQYVKTL